MEKKKCASKEFFQLGSKRVEGVELNVGDIARDFLWIKNVLQLVPTGEEPNIK